MNKKILTVGIAVYNIKEEYLRRCIESVMLNTLSDLEIIIVDDCSDESCSRVCREYRKADDRIVYIKNSENKGISGVRNMIIDLAEGEWLSFVDGDDMVSPSLGVSMGRLKDCENDLIIFNKRTFYDTPHEVSERGEAEKPARLTALSREKLCEMAVSALNRTDNVKAETDGFNLNPASVCSVVYRKSFLTDRGFRFNESLKVAEDSVFSAAVLLGSPRAALYNETIYYYRINPNSVTNRYDENSKSVTDAYLKVIAEFIKNNFGDSGEVMSGFIKYRCTRAVIDNFERNIFHRDNPKPRNKRKSEFYSLLESEPYKTALLYTDSSLYTNHRIRMTVKLAKKKSFFWLDLFYNYDILFKIYGGVMHRLNKLKKRFS